MRQRTQLQRDASDDPEGAGRGLYDPGPVAEADLWFLPDEGAVLDEDHLLPGPRVERRGLFDAAEWQEAQNRLSGELAELAAVFGALDERLRSGPPDRCAGWTQRLALLEVAELGWWTGERIGIERLALWIGARIGATGEDAQALAGAGWAVRRLTSGPPPAAAGWEPGLVAFLGRTAPETEAVPDAIADLAEVMAATDGLHPVTQAAILFHAWRMLGQASQTPDGVRDVEAATLAARHGAAMARRDSRRSSEAFERRADGSGGARFLPLALTGPTALRAAGPVPDRLARWIAGATQATLAALLHVDRIGDWQVHATAVTHDLSGRTPARLIEALTAWPMISAPVAEKLTGASRAAVQRNLDVLVARGLVREVSGQGRYRVWAAAL
jgi:hypothetical protein